MFFKKKDNQDEINTALIEALDAWKSAESYFNQVSDHAYVEFAIFQLEAAKRRYLLLLRQIKEGA